jgi:serpin B
LLVAVAAGGCASATYDASSPAGAVRASNRFGFELYAEVKQKEENLICSPVGAAIALSMASAGARGKTLEEMTKVLHLEPKRLSESHASFGSLLDALNDRDGRDGVALEVADQLWGHDDIDFEDEFLSTLETQYRAGLERLDFEDDTEAARGTINAWAAAKTHGRIREIVSPGAVHEATRVVLTNAVYFKGAWVTQFQEGSTGERPFQTSEGARPVKMMAQRRQLRHAAASGVSLVELPYKGGLSMVVVLPDDVNGLDAVERRLVGSYDDWLASMTFKEVDLWLPRFRVTSSLSLGTSLAAMGMPTAFEKEADFTGMAKRRAGERPIVIDRVLQRAFIEVDEIGTEAAAVTAVAMAMDISLAGPEPERVVFHADHPFVYVIRDTETGAVLFAGRFVAPVPEV